MTILSEYCFMFTESLTWVNVLSVLWYKMIHNPTGYLGAVTALFHTLHDCIRLKYLHQIYIFTFHIVYERWGLYVQVKWSTPIKTTWWVLSQIFIIQHNHMMLKQHWLINLSTIILYMREHNIIFPVCPRHVPGTFQVVCRTSYGLIMDGRRALLLWRKILNTY